MIDTLTVISQYIERIRRLGTLCSRNDITVLVVLIIFRQRRDNSGRSENRTCVCYVERIYHIQGYCGHNAAFPCDTEICQQYSMAFDVLSQYSA